MFPYLKQSRRINKNQLLEFHPPPLPPLLIDYTREMLVNVLHIQWKKIVTYLHEEGRSAFSLF